ncbi:MAG: 30S ribosomal protein S17 [Chloroflexi bacterium]|nr:30S ribosomal protein S17 [Chloroflexota bacterium]
MAKQMRKVRVGSVVSTSMDRTAVVDMVWKQRHRLYRKQMRRVARFYIHDPENQCRVGDTVRIQETRPISKTKHWRLLEILQRRQVAEVRPIELETDIETVIAGAETSVEAALEELETGAADTAEEEPETAAAESVPEAPAPARRQRATRSRRATADPAEEEPETAAETPIAEANESSEATVEEQEAGEADSAEEEPETGTETPIAEADESGEAAVEELETGTADSAEEESKE